MIILGEDGLRSQYVPPQPTVKILKRPTGDSRGSGDGPLLNDDKPKQPIKSLKQVYNCCNYFTVLSHVYKQSITCVLYDTNNFRENKNMRKQERESQEKRKVQRKRWYRRLIEFSQSRVHRMVETYLAMQSDRLLVRTVPEASTYVGSASSRDQLFPPIFISSFLATIKKENGYEADGREQLCVLSNEMSGISLSELRPAMILSCKGFQIYNIELSK